jgi:molybdopterin-synthase adenylyltransferase
MKKPPMSDELLLRYSRQIMLPDVDIKGQELLRNSKALVIGLGGLGCPTALCLASAGVGELVLADFDKVEVSNLQRQIAHSEEMIGENKAESAANTARQLNGDVNIKVCQQKMAGELLATFVRKADVVVDCTDSYESRAEISRACIMAKVPLVAGAAIRWEGQLSVFDYRQTDSPCYHCLYGNIASEQLSCSEAGILSPIVGIVGSMQALEAIKVLTRLGQSLAGRVLLFDGILSSWREFKLSRDPGCKVCGTQ